MKMRMNLSHAFFMWKSQEALMSIDEGLSAVFNFLGYFGLGECKRSGRRGRNFWGKGRLLLGSPWTPRLKSKDREKARVSIGRAFEVRGSN
ncbi:hypothetical protein CDL15_Pgr014184 [Punica granatum]|uniref:Uncharacterized protein n=1 Tax=Punica granatum TaxID=22663 RepID=A0A218XI51_PUNGR|nr:hypothetical protein CDL15_Pgr014184 [Punica granatum]